MVKRWLSPGEDPDETGVFLLLSAVSLVSGPAMSADFAPAVFSNPTPILAPVYSWTGCYLGGNGGGAWSTWTSSNPTDNPTVPGTRGDISVNDVIAGGQVGCDYQAGGVVLGIQGNFDWSPHLEGRFSMQ
jgi:outer membrane immunogenic protein